MSNTVIHSNLQTEFLNMLVKSKQLTAVYLKNGIKLKARILGFDDTCIIIDSPISQLIQLTSVSTVAPILTFEQFQT